MFNKTEIVNAQLPGVIMNEFIPLPSNEIRVDFSSDRDNRALKAAEQYKNYVVLLVPDYNANIASKNAYYKRGVVAKIVLNMTSPNGVRRVKIQTIVRCDIKGFVEDGTGLIVDFTTVPSFSSDLTKEDATFDLVRKFVTENAIDTSLSKDNINILNKSLTRDEFTDILAFTIHLDKNSKLRYLMETDTTIRLGYVLEDLYKQKMFKDLEIKIENSVKKSINESQKEYYLREKMKAIQEELG